MVIQDFQCAGHSIAPSVYLGPNMVILSNKIESQCLFAIQQGARRNWNCFCE